MFKKAVAIFSLIAYLITTVIPHNIFANGFLKQSISANKPTNSFLQNIPSKFGKIYKTNISDNTNPDAIIILDMHCQSYVQKNIYSLIKYFDKTTDIDKIFIEGAPKGKIDISLFDDIDNETRTNIFNTMLNKGLLSGSEYFAYMQTAPKLYGIEDFDLYKKALQQYYFLSKNETYFLYVINSVQREINRQKIKYYSQEMFDYNKIFTDNNFENIKTLILLKALIDKTNINIENYPEIKNFILIKEYEQKLKKEKLQNVSIQYLLAILKTKMSFSRYSQILNELKNKTIEENFVLIYPEIKNLLTDTDLQKFSFIETIYQKYLLDKQFDLNNFFKQTEILKQDIREKLFKEENLADLAFLDEQLKLLKKYAVLKLSFDEAEKLFYNKEKFEKLIDKYDYIKNKKEILEISDNKILQSYYNLNIKRNSIFVENIVKEITPGKTNVIVAGGFHKNISKLLAASNLKYAIIMPNAVANNYITYKNILSDIVIYNFNAISDGLLVTGTSQYKIKFFLSSLINELKNKNFGRNQIEDFLHKFLDKNKKFFRKINYENIISTLNNLSIKGLFLKIKQFINDALYKLNFNFKYDYKQNINDVNDDTAKKMETNVRFFMLMQIVLGFNLFVSFDTLFMQASGYSLSFISLILSMLTPVTFITSLAGGVISDRVSNRNIIISALALQSIGTILFAFSGCSALVLIASQVLPTIGIAALSLSLSPFLYETLDNIEQTDKFKEIYGASLSLKWIVMAVSSLIGGLVAYVTSQGSVIILTAIPNILITIASLKFTYNERIKYKTEQKFSIKENLSGFMQPLKQIYSTKESLALVLTNMVVNNIFFVVMCFFLQPVLFTAGSVVILAPVYFAANILQAAASYLINKTDFISKNKIPRNLFFITVSGLFGLFIVTGNPLFFEGVFLLMNFWQGSATLTETDMVYNILDDTAKAKWLSFKSVFGMLISTITQISITGLLAAGFSNNSIITASVMILTAGSFLISALFKDKQKQNDPANNVADIDTTKQILTCA